MNDKDYGKPTASAREDSVVAGQDFGLEENLTGLSAY